MGSQHISDKLQRKLDKEGIKVKHNNVRFTVTHKNRKGEVLGREWYKGYIAATEKRLLLSADGVKFVNIKGSDERFSAVKFVEDNIACLEVKVLKEALSERGVVFHIYTDKVDKFLKRIAQL
ncbi:hypothetical protein [uncultured Neptuniibacter sp.]|uniref:hypothetical protein n=1 Tax=uncultured Neptuniibacter sp. TaxID=502143 RepID=UPI002628DC6B|nr:hypothetical protein [uncultured Neptuniibacter sp.]